MQCYIIFNKIRRDPYEKGSILASGCCSAFSLATPVFAGKAESTEPAQNTENALTEPFDLAQEGNFDPEEFPYAQDNVLVKLSPDSGDAVTPVLAQCGVARLEHLFDGTLHPEEGREDARRDMGIGLSVCRTIVVAHGGSITASNQKNGGALFRIALPMEKEEIHEN